MSVSSCSINDYVFIIVTVGFAIVEFYLGRTDKTKSGSILELIYNILLAIMRRKK